MYTINECDHRHSADTKAANRGLEDPDVSWFLLQFNVLLMPSDMPKHKYPRYLTNQICPYTNTPAT